MSTTLLATKYHRPDPAPDLVPRPRATALLEAGLRGRLILVSAPAGFGKTTLVAGWLQQRMQDAGGRMQVGRASDSACILPSASFSAAWLALDADDSTPARFWAYVIAALQAAAPGVGRAAQAALQSPQPPPIEATLTALINDLAELEAPLLLVLDDYHLISSPAIHRSLDQLLEHLPQRLRLLLITREDPPLALARLRAHGWLAEIRAADLRFSAEEAADFLGRSLALPDADIATLTARTEGWITGLRLAALSLQQADDPHAFVVAFGASHRFLTDYLIDEVLDRQPPQRRRFLLRTALLSRLCAPLCDALMQDAPGPERHEAAEALALAPTSRILHELERANLFLVPLDHERTWYRYHHLFAEFLRQRLREAEPELIPTLYQRALAWCREQGLLREALGYALSAGDHEGAAELIESLAPEVISREGPEAVLAWAGALPAPMVRQRPLLGVHYAWALIFAGRMAEAAALLGAAEHAAQGAPAADRRRLGGLIAAHRAYIYLFQGEFSAALDEARRALAHLPDGDVLRIRTAVVLSSVLRFLGRLPEAEGALAPLAAAVQADDSIYSAMLYYTTLGEIHQERGQLHEAWATFSKASAFALGRTGRADPPFTGFAHIASGHVQREWNDLDAAAASIAHGVALCRAWRQADALAIGLIDLAQLHQDRGELALAQQALDELRQIVATMCSPWGEALADVAQARLDLARGDLEAVGRWALARGLANREPSANTQIDEFLTYAQLLLARGDCAGGERVLAPLADQLRAAGRVDWLIAVLTHQAIAQAGLGRQAAALAALGEALRLGEPGGYLRVFVGGGPTVAALLGQLHGSGGAAGAYLARVLAACAGGSGDPAPGPQPAACSPQPLIEPLNARELSILRLMAAGLANRAIGDELYLSVNTVRWYASQIFAKLGVGGRGAAVARARQLGLV